LQREIYPLGINLNPNCFELLKALAQQESETIKAVLVYHRKIIQFEKEFNKSTASDLISYEMKYDEAIAGVSEIAEELGLKLP
jgi:hypothetical protein